MVKRGALGHTKSTAPLAVKVRFDTVCSLVDVLTAQLVHAQRLAEQGMPTLLEQWEDIKPLYLAMVQYVDTNSR